MYQMDLFGNSENESTEAYGLSLPDFHAKLSALLENVKDLQTRLEVLSFLKSSGSHLFSDPNFYSLKMWTDLETMTEEERSELSSAHWMSWGTWENGKCLTARPTFLKTESGYSLSQVLEDAVPEKYFLSDEKTAKLLMSLEDSHSPEKINGTESTELGG
jgi:hypothetical protein